MKILIFGKSGQLASEFQRLFENHKNVYQVGRDESNFLEPDQVVKLMREFRPTHILNTAAYTAVDAAETDREAALQINGNILGIIGEVAKKLQSSVTHFSTDYVFNGQSQLPYKETDRIEPVNFYGLTKSIGDEYLANAGCQFQIFRVSWVYGIYGHNFLKTMLKLGKEKAELRIVSDQIGTPTASFTVAKAVENILKDKQLPDKNGTYHMAPFGQTNWCNFAEQIFTLASAQPDKFKIITESLVPISSSEFKSAAKRPQFSLMSSDKLKATFGIEFPEWNESLKATFKKL